MHSLVQTPRVGSKLGPYELLAPIGAGGMGEVWRARDTRLDRIVAIKFCKDPFNSRFEREARAIASLNHPNICQLYDVGPDYLVMECIEGRPIGGPHRSGVRSGAWNRDRRIQRRWVDRHLRHE